MKKKYIIKYLFEFIVIVLGVSVSFWLSEISINNQNEKERIKVLTSLQMENKEIRNYCDERNQSWLTDINLLNQFLSLRNKIHFYYLRNKLSLILRLIQKSVI